MVDWTVSDHKDTKFWNQFTTQNTRFNWRFYCFRPQRYKILKPIHNTGEISKFQSQLFQTTKIQNFETNSQPGKRENHIASYCFRPQRYKILKPIHNPCHHLFVLLVTVSDHKDTKFWNQFTTKSEKLKANIDCFRPQRYKILKPIHNECPTRIKCFNTVSDHKDTKFWNQFTTRARKRCSISHCFRPQRYKILKPIHNAKLKNQLANLLFQTTKIQNFETNSQQRY